MELTDEMLSAHAALARDLWLATLPARSAVPEYTVSPSFRRKMARLLREQRRRPGTVRFLRRAKRTAAVVLAAALLLFAGLMTVTAYRERVLQLVMQVYEDLTEFRFTNAAQEAETAPLPDVVLSGFPEDMELTEDSYTPTRHNLVYESPAGQFFRLSYNVIPPKGFSGSILDTEHSHFREITLRGLPAYCNENEGHTLLLWTDGPVIYQLSGNLPTEELIAIAEKIKILQN